MQVSDVQIRIARPDEYGRVLAIYAALGYRRTIDPADTVWLAESGKEAAGIVRVAAEQGTLVLRGMRIAEHARRQRLGTRMLEAIADWLGDRECYCVPYPYLVGFYGQIGFTESVDAPVFLAERVAEYRRSGQEAILMRKPAAPIFRAFVKELKNDLAGAGRVPVHRSVLADQAGERMDRRRVVAISGGFAVGADDCATRQTAGRQKLE